MLPINKETCLQNVVFIKMLESMAKHGEIEIDIKKLYKTFFILMDAEEGGRVFKFCELS